MRSVKVEAALCLPDEDLPVESGVRRVDLNENNVVQTAFGGGGVSYRAAGRVRPSRMAACVMAPQMLQRGPPAAAAAAAQVLDAVGGWRGARRALTGWLWLAGWSYRARYWAAVRHLKVRRG